ncbi:hypothetical protein ACSBR2_015792 [Camellia fascicularis]
MHQALQPPTIQITTLLYQPMASARRQMMINGGNSTRKCSSGRPIPRRGQVKVAIVLGVSNSLASLFSSKISSFRLSH